MEQGSPKNVNAARDVSVLALWLENILDQEIAEEYDVNSHQEWLSTHVQKEKLWRGLTRSSRRVPSSCWDSVNKSFRHFYSFLYSLESASERKDAWDPQWSVLDRDEMAFAVRQLQEAIAYIQYEEQRHLEHFSEYIDSVLQATVYCICVYSNEDWAEVLESLRQCINNPVLTFFKWFQQSRPEEKYAACPTITFSEAYPQVRSKLEQERPVGGAQMPYYVGVVVPKAGELWLNLGDDIIQYITDDDKISDDNVFYNTYCQSILSVPGFHEQNVEYYGRMLGHNDGLTPLRDAYYRGLVSTTKYPQSDVCMGSFQSESSGYYSQ